MRTLVLRIHVPRITKAEIVDAVHEALADVTRKEAANIVETVLEVIKASLVQGEMLKISGFGNFVVRDKKERKGRDPQRDVPIVIRARRVLTFKPSVVLRTNMNRCDPR